jgi:hypothetical protein
MPAQLTPEGADQFAGTAAFTNLSGLLIVSRDIPGQITLLGRGVALGQILTAIVVIAGTA